MPSFPVPVRVGAQHRARGGGRRRAPRSYPQRPPGWLRPHPGSFAELLPRVCPFSTSLKSQACLWAEVEAKMRAGGWGWGDVRAHAWAGGCTYLLGAYVLGIRPGKPGYESLLFAPCQSMDAFQGVVPTVKGLVAVNCKTIDGKRNYTLCVPRGMEVEPVLPSGAQLNVVDYELDS